MNVLICSRAPQTRAWVGTALGPSWVATEATDGLEALHLVREEIFDLLVADESTEPFGAFGLAREVKILPDPPKVIVLLDRAQDTWLAKWSGADRWFCVPVDPFELAAAAGELAKELAAAEPAEEPSA